MILVFLKVGQVHGNLNAVILRKRARQSVPKVLQAKLARRICERWVEDQTQREKEIRLPHSVLADDHCMVGNGYVEKLEVTEVLDLDSSDSHGVSPFPKHNGP